ncbi:MAG TPA: hypothetical protein VGC79_29155 [Polyangiaceae bacterium]
MKTTAWRWLILLLIPGCLLVQPLDEAKPDDDDSASAAAGKPSLAGSAGKASQAGSAGQHSGGSGPGAGGTGNRAGSGPLPTAGAANGGAPSGVDFSLFLGDWTVNGGKNTVSCDGSTPQTSPIAGGDVDNFGLGTISDLIFGPDAECQILADVNDRTASLNPATPNCQTADADYDYVLYVDDFQFVVSRDGKTAKASMTSVVYVYDISGNVSICDSDYTWDYAR